MLYLSKQYLEKICQYIKKRLIQVSDPTTQYIGHHYIL
jgi:hypothetical protein